MPQPKPPKVPKVPKAPKASTMFTRTMKAKLERLIHEATSIWRDRFDEVFPEIKSILEKIGEMPIDLILSMVARHDFDDNDMFYTSDSRIIAILDLVKHNARDWIVWDSKPSNYSHEKYIFGHYGYTTMPSEFSIAALACIMGRTELTKYLYYTGARLIEGEMQMMLFSAVHSWRKDMFDFLIRVIEPGVCEDVRKHIYRKNRGAFYDTMCQCGYEPDKFDLEWALRFHRDNIAAKMVKYHNMHEMTIDFTPIIHFCVRGALWQTTKQILINNPDLVDEPNAFGETPLMLAVKAGNYKIAEMLIDMGANIWLQNNNKQDAYDYACFHNRHMLTNKLGAMLKATKYAAKWHKQAIQKHLSKLPPIKNLPDNVIQEIYEKMYDTLIAKSSMATTL